MQKKDHLAQQIKNRIEIEISRFEEAGIDEYDVSFGMRNNLRTVVIKRKFSPGISHYIVNAIESVLKDYRLSPLFYFIEIDTEEMKPTIEIFVV